MSGWPTEDELLALANHFEEQGDPRAEIARHIRDPKDVWELLGLLTESDMQEAACVFAERAVARERAVHLLGRHSRL